MLKLADLQIPDTSICIHGKAVFYNENGFIRMAFNTTPRTILEDVCKSINIHFRDGSIALTLDNTLYNLTVRQNEALMNMPLTGDMFVPDKDRAYVDPYEAIYAIGTHIGVFPPYWRDDMRTNYTTSPIPALEIQVLLDAEQRRWDTLNIVTDSNLISAYFQLNEVLDLVEKHIKEVKDSD